MSLFCRFCRFYQLVSWSYVIYYKSFISFRTRCSFWMLSWLNFHRSYYLIIIFRTICSLWIFLILFWLKDYSYRIFFPSRIFYAFLVFFVEKMKTGKLGKNSFYHFSNEVRKNSNNYCNFLEYDLEKILISWTTLKVICHNEWISW